MSHERDIQANHSQRLPLLVTRQIDAVSDEFEQLLRANELPTIGPFLERVDEVGRETLLDELTTLAVEHLLKERVKDPLAQLTAANPELASKLELLTAKYAATHEQRHGAAAGCGLHVRCPHCQNPIELVPDANLEGIPCPSCGSDFSLVSDDSVTRGHIEVSQISHFQLVERVGMGAYGSVWKALDTKLDRTVAVKIPRKGQFDEFQEKAFIREAQNAAQLNHPNIVPVYEVGRDGDTLYIVSEFVRGVTLADWLAGQRATAREATQITVKIAEALQHAHLRGVIHRDLKPSNIMLGDRDEPRLLDFGLARRDAEEITITLDGQILGTPAYMSPEQARGNAHMADQRSDVYSLGVILFQLLTGELPFRGSTRMLVHQVIHDDAPSPRKLNSNTHRDLETICLKCLEKSPEKRYQTAISVAEDLGRHLCSEPIHARPPSMQYRFVKYAIRHRKFVGTAAAFIAFLVAGLAVTSSLYLDVLRSQAHSKKSESLAHFAMQQAESKAKQYKSIVELTIDSIKGFNPWNDGVNSDPTGVELLVKIRDALLENSFSGDALTKANLLEEIGSSLSGLSAYDQALMAYKTSSSLRKKNLGHDHLDTLSSLLGLASCYDSIEREKNDTTPIKQALTLYQNVMQLAEKSVGRDHPTTIYAAEGTAGCQAALGNNDLSVEIYKELIARAKSKLGPLHEVTLRLQHNIAVLYWHVGNTIEAEKAFRSVLEIGSDGEKLDEECNLISRGNLGLTLHVLGRLNESLTVLEETLAQSKAMLGKNHNYTCGFAAPILQSLLLETKEYDRAEQVIREWRSFSEPTRARYEIDMAWADISMAEVLLAKGEIESSRKLAERSLKVSGLEKEELIRARSILGACLIAENQWDQAESLLIESYRSLRKQLPRLWPGDIRPNYKRWYVSRACERIINLYEAWGKPAKVDEWKRELFEVTAAIEKLRIISDGSGT